MSSHRMQADCAPEDFTGYDPRMHRVFAQAVRDAAQRPQAVAAVLRLHEQLEQAIRQRGPRCELSGRCCHFEKFGHRLYVTTLDVAAFLAADPPPPGEIGEGCPFQQNGRCGVHAIRPLGCRIFFCDPSAEQWMQEQYEILHSALKRLHEDFEVPYFYLEWRQALRSLR